MNGEIINKTSLSALTPQERLFYERWTKKRQHKQNFLHFLIIGLRNGFIFSALMLLSLMSGWYKRIPFLSLGDWVSLTIGMFLSVCISAILYCYYRLDQCEQEFKKITYKLRMNRAASERTPSSGSEKERQS